MDECQSRTCVLLALVHPPRCQGFSPNLGYVGRALEKGTSVGPTSAKCSGGASGQRRSARSKTPYSLFHRQPAFVVAALLKASERFCLRQEAGCATKTVSWVVYLYGIQLQFAAAK